MARPANNPAPARDAQPKTTNGVVSIPTETDAKSELMFLLGTLKGLGIEGADRITTLVILLTKPQPAETE